MYEITFIDNGYTVYWSKPQCEEYFGKDEFVEVLGGYFPHIVAVELPE